MEIPNISLVEGSFSDLSAFDDGEFDLVFGIETVSYSDNKERVVSEIARVLSPGGKLILFDIYEPKPQSEMTDFEKRVSAITFATMRLPAEDQYIGDVKKYLARHQFSQIDTVDLTEKIVPSLARLERYSEYYFHHRLFLKTLKKVLPYDANINGIAGWLMPLTFDGENVRQYNRIVATKK